MNSNSTASATTTTGTAPILMRPEDPSSRVHPDSGSYDGTNLRGELRLRAALPVSRHLQDHWSGLLMEQYRLEDLSRLAGLNDRAFVAQDKLYAVTRAKAEQLLALFSQILLDPDLSTPNASTGLLALRTMTDFGLETPEQFSLIWFVQSCEEALQQLHRELREQSHSRDRRMATLHHQKFSELIGQFLALEAQEIADHGLDLPDDPDDHSADDLERQLLACAIDPMQTLWPAPSGGRPIQQGWEGLAEDMTDPSSLL